MSLFWIENPVVNKLQIHMVLDAFGLLLSTVSFTLHSKEFKMILHEDKKLV